MRNIEKMRAAEKRYKAKCWRRSIRCGPEICEALVRMRNQTGTSVCEYIQMAVTEKYGNFPIEEMKNESRRRGLADPV